MSNNNREIKKTRKLTEDDVSHANYIFVEGPGHGWLLVPMSDLRELKLLEKLWISEDEDADVYWLEEDEELAIFMQHMEQFKPFEYEVTHCDCSFVDQSLNEFDIVFDD